MSKWMRGWLMTGGAACALFLVLIGSQATPKATTQQATSDPKNAAPPMPYVEYDVCPFECCTYRDWKASRSITAYERWRDPRNPERSKVAFGIQRGEVVTAMTGLVMTTKPGKARAPKDGVLEVGWRRFIGRPNEKLPIHAGDTIYLLVPHSQHTYTAWFGGALLDQIVPVVADPANAANAGQPFEGIEQPAYEWWVRVRNDQGEVGWTDRAHDFSGADACSTALPSRGFR